MDVIPGNKESYAALPERRRPAIFQSVSLTPSPTSSRAGSVRARSRLTRSLLSLPPVSCPGPERAWTRPTMQCQLALALAPSGKRGRLVLALPVSLQASEGSGEQGGHSMPSTVVAKFRWHQPREQWENQALNGGRQIDEVHKQPFRFHVSKTQRDREEREGEGTLVPHRASCQSFGVNHLHFFLQVARGNTQ